MSESIIYDQPRKPKSKRSESIICDQLNRPKSKRGDIAGSLTKLNFDEQLARMGELNPAYKGALDAAPGISKALREELQAVFFGDERNSEGQPVPFSKRTLMAHLDSMTTSLSTRADQIEDIREKSADKQPELSRKESESSVRTFLKTAQEVLSHPDDRRAFDRGKGTVEDIVIDPLQITDTLLTNLGLTQYIPEKGTKEAEKVRQRAMAIPDIRKMLAQLEPISLSGQPNLNLKYFRLMLMSGGENEGMILGTQVIKGQKVLFKTDLYGAGRRIAHIEAGYLEEIDLLQDISSVVENALGHIDNWSDVEESDLAEIRSGMLECIDSLENVEDEDKVALREQLELSFTFRDSTGRLNPQVMEARLLSAKRHIAARIQSIENISAYLKKDKLKMHRLVKEQVDPVNKFLAELDKKPEDDKTTDKTPKWKRTEMRAKIETLKGLSAQQKYEPYLSFGRKFSAQLEKSSAALEANDLETAAHEFTKVYLIAKLERAYKEIQSVYSKISLHPETTDPVALKAELQGIYDRVREHDFAPNRKTDEYTPAFIEVYHLLNSLKMRLTEMGTPAETQSDEPALPPTPKQTRKTRMEEVLERVSRIPAVEKVVTEIRKILFKVLDRFKDPKSAKQAAQPAPAQVLSAPAEAPKQPRTKEEAFAAMKKRIKEFDFRALAQELPV